MCWKSLPKPSKTEPRRVQQSTNRYNNRRQETTSKQDGVSTTTTNRIVSLKTDGIAVEELQQTRNPRVSQQEPTCLLYDPGQEPNINKTCHFRKESRGGGEHAQPVPNSLQNASPKLPQSIKPIRHRQTIFSEPPWVSTGTFWPQEIVPEGYPTNYPKLNQQ